MSIRNPTLGRRLAVARKAAGFTQVQVGEYLTVPSQWVSHLEFSFNKGAFSMRPLANTTVFGLAFLDDVPILLAYHLNENVDLIESWTRDQTQLPRTPEEGNAWLHALTWHLIDYSDDLALRIRRRWTVRNITIQETDWLGDVHCFVFTRADGTELGRIYPAGPADMYWTFVQLDEGHDPFLEAWEDGFGHPISPNGWSTDPAASPPPDFTIY